MTDPIRPLDVVVVGQTPPPYMGQAIMMQLMLDGAYSQLRLHHVPTRFSRDIQAYGHFRWEKLFHLLGVIARIAIGRFRTGAEVLYHVPAGPNRVPMYRDFAILLATRWMFRHLVLHYHAAGLSELYPALSPVERLLFRLAYRNADMAIRISPMPPDDGAALGARQVRIVPNGLEDMFAGVAASRAAERPVPRLVYIGVLRASKGVLVLLDACRRLRDRGVPFTVRLIGEFTSDGFREEVLAFLTAHRLEEQVELTGLLSGDAKWNALAACDIMVFPSYFESESSGRVVLEAMSLGMPVVATDWRGIGCLVEDGVSGYLVPIRDSEALARQIDRLLADPALRAAMGRRGRALYEANYTAERFWQNMEDALLAVRHNTGKR